jgi:methyltransferase (TIGR00027 family)
MESGRPSRTAFAAAMHRAAHQLADGGRLFEDPYAVPIVGVPESDILARSNRVMRYFIAARSRFAEDHLARAYARGVRQLVVLGAGLDTFAYRNPYPDLQVFEVDHPSTQAWKRERLSEAGIAIPSSAHYVPVDFEHQSLAAELRLPDGPAFYLWLGVVPYLTSEAITATLNVVAARPGNEVVFDYADPPESLSPRGRAAPLERARRVASIGEPWRTYFTPDALAADLHERGLTDIEDLGPAQLAAIYLNRTDLAPDMPGGHVIWAARPSEQ